MQLTRNALAATRAVTTAAHIAEQFESVRADQVMRLVETDFAGVLKWNTMRGRHRRTLLYSQDAPIADLLQKSWVSGRVGNEKLREQNIVLRKQLEEAQASKENQTLEEGPANLNKLIWQQMARIMKEYTGRQGSQEFDINKLDLDAKMGKLDSRLLKFLDCATLN